MAKSASCSIQIEARVALVEFSRKHRQNPFSQARMRELGTLMKELESNDDVGCIVLTGGEGRSFSVGGDFNEVSAFSGGDEVDVWVDDFTHLYTSIAGISKPVVAAIDGYAIGLGLQIALCCDYRIGSDVCQLIMPELQVGLACNFGGFMLEAVVGRAVMQAMLFTSDKWNAKQSLKAGLLQEVVPAKKLVPRAVEHARKIGAWAASAVRGTRLNINATFVAGLYSIGEEAKRAHRNAFAQGRAQVKMREILQKKQLMTPSWILFTNLPVASLDKMLQAKKTNGIHVYGNGAALTSSAFSWVNGDHILARTSAWTTSIDISRETVRIKTAAMNVPPLFMVRNSSIGAWAVGTDSFILNIVRLQWGMPVKLADPTVVNRDETTSFVGVKQLPAHSSFELKKDGVDWRLTAYELNDPVLAALSPQVNDFDQAGSLFVSSIQKAVNDTTEGTTVVATMLSGGIDSGAVTTFAHLSGLAVTAYSAGTPWGNEHNEAHELTEHLGISHVCVDFTAEELLSAIPETMRALGSANYDRVDIALIITAIMRKGTILEHHVLTGYGSDLLNMGLPTETDEPEEMMKEIVDGIDATRHSCEFTDFVARARGKRLSHPYWHEDVVRTALNIHPACKIRNGREKAFFRAAMEPFVPRATAWRAKIGIHQGGGLQDGLDALFGGRDKKIKAYNTCFEALTLRLLIDPVAEIDDLAPNPSLTNSLSPSNHGIKIKTRLTPSGAGIVLATNKTQGHIELAREIQEQIGHTGFVLARGLDLNEKNFQSLVHALGNPVDHRYQTGQSDLMKLNATREKGNVVLGRGSLPLHTDGILLGKHPDLIVLYASEFSDEPGSGETFICDQVAAWKEMPEQLRKKLESGKLEYKIEEGNYYEGGQSDWFERSIFRERGGQRSLNLALQFEPGVERSWSLRMAGVDEANSTKILTDLNNFLMKPRFTYQHRWRVGDLVVIDNARSLHGRTSIGENGVRVLLRGQINRHYPDS